MPAKTRVGRKFLEKKEPKLIENRKKSLFVKGRKFPHNMQPVWDTLDKFRHSENVKLTHTNDLLPFEDISPLEELCKKNDCSLFTFFSHNKKRMNNIVFGRIFDHHVLDMYEFGVENIKTDLPLLDVEIGDVPALMFQGEAWETDLAQLRSYFMDFFVGEFKEKIDICQVQHLLVFTAVDDKVLLRHYKVTKEGTEAKITQTAPSYDLVKRRVKLAEQETLGLASEKPPEAGKKKEHITKDALGRDIGRVFVAKEKLGELRMRKFTALPKKSILKPQQFDTE